MYSCGARLQDLDLEERHPLTIVYAKSNLTCSSPTNIMYYSAQYEDICFWCSGLNDLRITDDNYPLLKLHELHHTAHSLNWYKNHANRQQKIKQQHHTAMAMLRLEYTWTFTLRCNLEGNSIAASQPRWSHLQLEYTIGLKCVRQSLGKNVANLGGILDACQRRTYSRNEVSGVLHWITFNTTHFVFFQKKYLYIVISIIFYLLMIKPL